MSLLISVLLLRLDTTTQSYWRNSAAANPHFHRPKNQTCRSVTKRKLRRFTWETCIWELLLNFYSLNIQPFSRGNNCNWFNVASLKWAEHVVFLIFKKDSCDFCKASTVNKFNKNCFLVTSLYRFLTGRRPPSRPISHFDWEHLGMLQGERERSLGKRISGITCWA